MLRKILSFIFPDFRMWFSGGGGGDNSDAIRNQELKREADMTLGSRRINSLFGIYDPANFDANGNYVGNTGIYGGQVTPTGVSGSSGGNTWPSGILALSGANTPSVMPDPNADQVYTQNDGNTYVLRDPYLANQAYQNKIARDAAYNKSHGDIMNFFTNGLDEQLQNSVQSNTYDLARKGLLKGSVDVGAEAGRTRTYDDALLRLTNEADTSISKLKTADETSRLNLLQSIRAGMDNSSAVAGATNALTNNMNNATNAAHATQFSGVFNDLNNLYKSGVYTQGTQRGINNPYGATVSPGYGGQSYSGTTVKY